MVKLQVKASQDYSIYTFNGENIPHNSCGYVVFEGDDKHYPYDNKYVEGKSGHMFIPSSGDYVLFVHILWKGQIIEVDLSSLNNIENIVPGLRGWRKAVEGLYSGRAK